MGTTALRREDGLGLGVAVVLHALLVALLLFQNQDRLTLGSSGTMTVTLGDGDSEAGSAPALGVPDAPEIVEQPEEPQEIVAEPQPRPVVEPRPRPTTSARPNPRPSPRPTTRSKPAEQPRTTQKQATQKQATDTRKSQTSKGTETGKKDGKGKSNFDSEFGDLGKSSGSTAEVKADIKVSIGSQVAPFWNRCRVSGLDIDKLRAVVSFRLDKSGKLSGWDAPRVTGQNAANSAQAGIFGECAVRALRQVGTFTGLPADRYDLWQSYEFEFRKR
ncbi:hypothetical protein WAB17_08800 [Parerythrobacter aurantius]|uniref:hypothetical protein n=1 Tax=Parerythrobacter aurantius TaxID=3127706 RepID=UPI00324FF9A4